MKQILIIAFLLAFSTSNSEAQIDVTINPIGLLFSNFDGGADIGFSDELSVEPRVGLNFGDIRFGGIEYSITGFTLGAIGKYYFVPQNGIDKWHVGPYISYNRGNLKAEDDPDVKRTRLGVGLYTGYKRVSARNIVFDIGLGLGRKFINKWENDSNRELDLSGIPFLNISAVGRLSLGYRFGGKN